MAPYMQSQSTLKPSFIVVQNLAFPSYYGPEPALVDFLLKQNRMLLYIQHPVPPVFKNLSSRSNLFKSGKREIRFAPYFSISDMRLLMVYNAIVTFFLVLLSKNRFSVFIGSDGRNALLGVLLKKMGFVKTTIYLTHSCIGKNSYSIRGILERFLDQYCSKSVDFVWNLSKKLTKIREFYGLVKEKNIWVPVGVNQEDIKKPVVFPHCNDKKRIIFVGVLSPGKGIELVIQALPLIMKTIKNVEVIIVGGGPLEKKLKSTCKELDVEENVIFKGYLEYNKLMEFLPLCHVGVATYEPNSSNTAFTTDPLKPKLYMASGLPVIITDFPETAIEIRKSGAGLVIKYDKLELANAIIKLLSDAKLFECCSSNAICVARKYEWNNIFKNALSVVF